MPLATVGRNALNRHSSEKQGAAMRAPGDHLLPAGLWRLEPTERGIRIRHAGHRSSCSAQQAPPARVALAGTGEVTRCLAVHGAGRVRAAVLAAPLRPFLLNMNNSPEGVGGSDFDAPLAGTGTRRSITAAAILPLPSGPGECLAGRQGRYLPSDPWRRATRRAWPGGLPGDQVELVAFDVGEGRPARLA